LTCLLDSAVKILRPLTFLSARVGGVLIDNTQLSVAVATPEVVQVRVLVPTDVLYVNHETMSEPS
jgi:hypothetical protein